MRKAILTILILLGAIGSNAQDLGAQNNETTSIAVFDGNVKNVPNGTIVNFWFPENGDYIGEAVTKINKGKFHFKKKINENTKYIITLGEDTKELPILAASGTTKITGSNDDCSHWRVENKNPMVIEENAYKDRRKLIQAEYEKELKLREKKGQTATRSVYSGDNLIFSEEQFYISSMYEFMKKRPYSKLYKDELKTLMDLTSRVGDFLSYTHLKKLVKELFVKLPFSQLGEYQTYYLYYGDVLDVGDDMEDFTLYDRKGFEHHLTELNGNGKYLLLEFCRKEDKGVMETRPENALNELYDKYSDYFDIVTVNCDSKDAWTSGKLPCDRWNEWNDHKSSLDVLMKYSTLFRYVFVSTKGKIMGFGNPDDFMDKAKKHFAFIQ